MTNDELQQLKALAEKIKSGSYNIDECNKFIDESGPDSILALIAKVESLAAPSVASDALPTKTYGPEYLRSLEEDEPVAGAASIDTKPLPDEFWELVSNCGGTKDLGKNARLLQEWVKRYALASVQKTVLTDIDALMLLEPFDLKIDTGTKLAVVRAIEAASGPNQALVEALQTIAAQSSGIPGSTAKADCMAAIARTALAAAGIEVKP